MLNTECKNDCNRSELKGIEEGKVNGVGTARGEQWQLDRGTGQKWQAEAEWKGATKEGRGKGRTAAVRG